MTAIGNGIAASPILYILLGILCDLLTLGCMLVAAMALLRVPMKKSPAFWAPVVLAAVAGGATRMLFRSGETDDLLWTTYELIYPFVAMWFFVPRGKKLRSVLLTFGWTFVEAVKYIILVLFFRYDNNRINDPVELTLELLLNTVLLVCLAALLRRRLKKADAPSFFLQLNPVLYLLVVLTVGVFVSSLALLDPAYTLMRQPEFIFTLLNIPLLAGTVGYTVFLIARGRQTQSRQQAQLEMQVKYYETLEAMNEDIRIFRHDLPKKLRPLIHYLEEDRTEEAKTLAASLSGFADGGGKRYRSGNFRLDTVLYTEQQLAARDNIEIELPFGEVFPKEGVTSDDIYTIFPNALDNAIEACRAVNGERKITVRSKIVGDTVYVSIRNPIGKEVTVKNGAPVTDKADKKEHGYGWRSMKKAAAKYGGDNMDFEIRDGFFELRLSLTFRGAAPDAAAAPNA